jgi:hypothetical protein
MSKQWTIFCGYVGCTAPASTQLDAPTRATVTCARHEAAQTRWCGGEGGPVTRTPIIQAGIPEQPTLFEQD